MRTTLDLPDELLTEIKILCAQERATLKVLISELLRQGIRARQATPRATTLPPPYRLSTPVERGSMAALRKEVRR